MFEPNEKMRPKIIENIKGRTVVIIDDFYKNPDEIRERALSLEHTDSTEAVGGFPGVRGFAETSEVRLELYDIYFHLCNKYFGLPDADKFSNNWDNQGFMVNILNDSTLKKNPLGIIPHQDYWESAPKGSPVSLLQYGSVVYLNTPDECAGGTNLYSHFGRMSIPDEWQPQWLLETEHLPSFEYIKSKVDGGKPYTCEFETEMVYNRMVLYQADVLHGQNVDLGMFTDYNRINQVLFM